MLWMDVIMSFNFVLRIKCSQYDISKVAITH